MDVSINLGRASTFMFFDAGSNRIRTIDNVLENKHYGDYTISVTAFLDDGEESESHTDRFTLKVNPLLLPEDPLEVEEEKFDASGIIVEKPFNKIWEPKYTKKTTTELGPYNPRQPIPFIKKFSDTGRLTIGWDRSMKKPDNLEELPESYIVVTDEKEADLIEKEGRYQVENKLRRLKKTREWFETEKEYLEYLLVMDALDIELIPGDEEEPQHLKFRWDLLDYDKN